MNRIGACLAQAKEQKRKALVTYIVAGDPNRDLTLPAMHQLVEAGADIIELGVPFSDPMAEGPVIQKGHERALAHQTSLRDCLALVQAFRESDQKTPVVLMGYANPVERMGYEQFAQAASNAGVDGVLTVDLPPEEAVATHQVFKQNGLESIFLLAPTSQQARVKQVAELAGGFIYYVSLKGVTGAGNLDVASVTNMVEQIHSHSDLPVMVGFGIKDADSAKAVGACAEGVVVGSALVELMGSSDNNAQALTSIKEKVVAIRQALDSLV